jgi:hypothetical protein
MELLEQKCTMVRKHNVFRRKYRRICSTDFWTVNNTSASNPAPFNQVPVASTYYLESGDFFRVNNISLGYKLPLAENAS